MTFQHTIWIAFGGAIGAVLRYGTMSLMGAWLGIGFPYGTMAVNILGGFGLGVFIELSALVWSPSAGMRSMIVIGLLGAFTTFSTFSLDAINLYTHGRWAMAAIYIVGSVIFSILAVWAGLIATRVILP